MISKISIVFLSFFLLAWDVTSYAQKRKKEEKQNQIEANNRQAEEYFIEGNKEYLLGRYDKAFDWFLKASKYLPNNSALNFKLTECFIQQNNLEKALQYAEKAVEADPKNKYYNILLGQLYERTKKYKDAIKLYEKVIKQSPGNEELLLNIANIYQTNGDFDNAIKSYSRLETVYGVNEEIARQKQLLYLKQNKLEDAIAEWKKLIISYPDNPNLVLDLANLLYVNNRNQEAKALLEEHLHKFNDSPFANLMLYEIYKKEGKLQKADQELEKAFNSPQLPIDAKIGVIVSHLKYINTDSSIKAQSLKLGQIVTKVHPKEAKAFAMNGDILVLQDKKQEALRNYIKSVELDNSHYKIWQQIIVLASELSQTDSIIKYSEKAIEIFPSQPLFFFYAGTGYIAKKDYKRAISYFHSGRKITINNPELSVQFLSQLGDSYQGLKDFQKSDSCYEEALKIDPENIHILNNYSYYLSLRKENLERAKKMCEKVIQKRPTEPAYLDTFGWILYQMKDYVNAKKYIEKALEKSNDATITEHYGDILFQLGEKQAALNQWEKAKKGEGYSELLDRKIAEKKLYE